MQKAEGVRKKWGSYKYVGLIMLIGVGLLLWPDGSDDMSTIPESETEAAAEAAEIRDLEMEMENILGTMSGVGTVKVMLTVDSDGERQLAQDTELSYSGNTAAPEDYSRRSETVLIDGSGGDGTVLIRRIYPTYRGALVVCQGGDRPEIQLAVTEAVSALTGLSADRIKVAKWQ